MSYSPASLILRTGLHCRIAAQNNVGYFLGHAVNKIIQSAVFGSLHLEAELPANPVYSAEILVEGHGAVSIALIAVPGNTPNWSSFLRAAEESHPVLLQHEPSIRRQAAPQILSIHREYGQEWRGPAVELVSGIRLRNLNYFSDGSFELWYWGGELFHHLDVLINLDADLRISEVGFDG